MKNQGIQVKEGRTELTVSHPDGEITFIAPECGTRTYFQLDKEITDANLEMPTMAQTASLVHAAWQNPDEKYSKRIIEMLKNGWLWASNAIRYVPKNYDGKLIEGAYIIDRPDVKQGKLIIDEEDILCRLEKKDPSVRYVEPNFESGELSSQELAKNAFVIALAGDEGAEKLAAVSQHYKLNPCLYIPNTGQLETRVAALDRRYLGRLLVVGRSLGYYWDGCSFGVRPSDSIESRAYVEKQYVKSREYTPEERSEMLKRKNRFLMLTRKEALHN